MERDQQEPDYLLTVPVLPNHGIWLVSGVVARYRCVITMPNCFGRNLPLWLMITRTLEGKEGLFLDMVHCIEHKRNFKETQNSVTDQNGFIALKKEKPRYMLKQRNTSDPGSNRKNHPTKNQALTRSPDHAFRWSQTTAWCTCGRWTLWPCTQENGQRNHGHHLANRTSRRPRKGGQDGLKQVA